MDNPKKTALRDIQRRLEGRGTILEVGFGDARFLNRLYKAGYSVVGTEVSEWMVRKAREKLPRAKILHTNDPLDLRSQFDAVCCFEVLEHLADPIALARKLPSSVLYASVPNPWRWYPAITGRYEYWDQPPNHLWKFCLCAPRGPNYHDPNCKLGDQKQLSPGQQAMSLRWILQQGEYDQVSIHPTAVESHDLLRVIPIRNNVECYDLMRPSGPLSYLTPIAREMLQPITYPMSSVLNLFGCQGVSFYICASRK